MSIPEIVKGAAMTIEATDHDLQWLALALTPGLGPTRSRRIVEHFASIEAVFRASY